MEHFPLMFHFTSASSSQSSSLHGQIASFSPTLKEIEARSARRSFDSPWFRLASKLVIQNQPPSLSVSRIRGDSMTEKLHAMASSLRGFLTGRRGSSSTKSQTELHENVMSAGLVTRSEPR